MALGGFRWLQMVSDGSRWLQISPDGCRWHQVAPDGFRWLQMALTESCARLIAFPIEQHVPTDQCLLMSSSFTGFVDPSSFFLPFGVPFFVLLEVRGTSEKEPNLQSECFSE